MNRISQKMIEISKKLSSEGLKQRSEQFIVIAEDLEDEIKIKKIRSLNIKKAAKKETIPIDENELKAIFNKVLTPYNKYKE